MSTTKILGPDGKPVANCVHMSVGFVPQPLKDAPQDDIHGVAAPLGSSWLRTWRLEESTDKDGRP